MNRKLNALSEILDGLSHAPLPDSGLGRRDPIVPEPYAVSRKSICVSFVGGPRYCAEVWEQWERLSASAPPFLQPEFFNLTRPIANPDGEPRLVVAVRAGRVAGVLPLTLHGHDLVPLRSDHSPRFDFWGDSGALSAIWEVLRADPCWERLVLGHIPTESRLASELPMLARSSGCFVKTSPSHGVPYFPLPGFEDNLGSKFRSNLRRCMRKAEDLKFERHTDPSASELADALAIEARAWKGGTGTSISSDAQLTNFYRALLGWFGPRGTMSLNFVTVAGQRIACLFTMEDGHTLYAAKIGFDPAYAALSPGHLMVALTAADAERRGLKVFDFLGEAADWKLKWTDRLRPHLRMVMHRPSVRGYARFVWRKAWQSRFEKAM